MHIFFEPELSLLTCLQTFGNMGLPDAAAPVRFSCHHHRAESSYMMELGRKMARYVCRAAVPPPQRSD